MYDFNVGDLVEVRPEARKDASLPDLAKLVAERGPGPFKVAKVCDFGALRFEGQDFVGGIGWNDHYFQKVPHGGSVGS